MKIYYGIPNRYIDITNNVFLKCKINEEMLLIQKNDLMRAYMFGDPCHNIEKHILIELNGKYNLYDADTEITIKIDPTEEKLKQIHSKLNFVGGKLTEEYEEQIMAVKFIKPTAKVLEFGSNTGRNSLIIASILEDSRNLITLETGPQWAKILAENRDNNNFSFHIINAALSKTPLFQRGWTCLPAIPAGETGYTEVQTTDYQTIKNTFGKTPDTLVADCEGALYYIFSQFPEILDDINLIIMENDYSYIEHKNFVDQCLTEKGFKCIYQQKLELSQIRVCQNNFYETWSK
jgi:hypothetical protein